MSTKHFGRKQDANQPAATRAQRATASVLLAVFTATSVMPAWAAESYRIEPRADVSRWALADAPDDLVPLQLAQASTSSAKPMPKGVSAAAVAARAVKKTRFSIPQAKVRAPFASSAEYAAASASIAQKTVTAKASASKSLAAAPKAHAAPAAEDLAETEDTVQTTELRALASSLNNNPVKIAQWVRNNIRFAPTYGSMQGADLTRQTAQGNAFDTASLTIALLRAAQIPSRYVYGTIEIPAAQAQNWVGGVTTPEAALDLFAQGGIPSVPVIAGGRVASIRLEHVWVEAYVPFYPARGMTGTSGKTWVPIDTACKQHVIVPGMDLLSVGAIDGNALAAQLRAGATQTPSGITGLNQTALPSTLGTYQSQVMSFITAQKPSATVGDVLGTQSLIADTLPMLAGTLPYKTVAQLDGYAAIPETKRWKLEYGVYLSDVERGLGTAIVKTQKSFAALAGNKLAVTFAPATAADQQQMDQAFASGVPASLPGYLIRMKAQLWQGTQPLGEGGSAQMGTNLVGAISLFDPRDGAWTEEPSHLIVTGETHALAVAPQFIAGEQLAASRDRLVALKNRFTSNQTAGLTQADIGAELLHHAALTWLAFQEGDARLVRATQRIAAFPLPSVVRAFTAADVTLASGVPQSVRFSAVALDTDVISTTAVAKDAGVSRQANFLRTLGARGSALGHLVLEQQFADTRHAGDAASAVRALTRANEAAQALHVVNAGNAATVVPQLAVADTTKTQLNNGVAAGLVGLTSQGNITIGNWTGSGYVLEDTASGGGDYAVTLGRTAVHAPLNGWNALGLAGAAIGSGQSTPIVVDLTGVIDRMVEGYTATVSLLANYTSVPWSTFVATSTVIQSGWTSQIQTVLNTPLGTGITSLVTAIGVNLTMSLTGTPTVNNPPRFTSTPATAAVINQLYQYAATATDPDGDALAFSLGQGPAGLTVAANGLVSWATPTQGVHEVVLRVSDGKVQVEQRYTLTVGNVLPLDAQLSVSPQFVNAGETVTITVAVAGGTGPVQKTLTVDGTAVALDAASQARITAAASGTHRIVATVTDGTTTFTRESFYAVRDSADTTPPVAKIDTPAADSEVTAPVNIVGTASDANLAQYQVLLSPAGLASYTVLATGTTSVTSGTLARFDPSTLTNGLWDVLLKVTDVNGVERTDLVTYEVTGNLKIGEFTISFLDLEVESAGIPVRVTRTYKSSRKGEKLDFGHGWSVGYQDVKLQKNAKTGAGWEVQKIIGTLELCLRPKSKRKIAVTLPDGKVERFEAKNRRECQEFQPPALDVIYNPIGRTTSTLDIIGVPEVILQGGDILDSGSFEIWNPKKFKLTTVEGFEYFLDESLGIETVREPDGNAVGFGPTGIVHSNGQTIWFERDSQKRITAVIDATGKKIVYKYDAAGDLVSVTNRVNEQSQMKYDKGHQLLSYIDSRGVELIRNEYDDKGRLIAQYDAQGNKIDLAQRQPDQSKEIVKNRLGATTTFEYDPEGNVTKQTDALNGVTTYTYDARGNEAIITDPSGRVTEKTWGPIDQLASEKDGLGNTTSYGYVPGKNWVTGITDPKGNTTSFEYAGGAIPSKMVDAEGAQTLIGASRGKLETLVDAYGNRTRYEYDTKDRRTKEWREDIVTGSGGTTFVTKEVTTFEYDANGNQTKTIKTRTVNGAPQTLVTTRTFDADGNVLTETDPTGAVTQTSYNSFKKVASTTDALGRVTRFDYENRGYETKITHPDGKTEEKSFDPEGNEATVKDRAGRATTTTYDLLNRPIKVTYPDGKFTENSYDGAGRLTSSKDERGKETTHEYDAAGRKIKTTAPDGGITRFDYDKAGNLTKVTDARGAETTHEYDKVNRRTKTTFPIVVPEATARSESYEYDKLGRRTATVDTAGNRAEFSYDSAGRLQKVTQASPNGTDPKPVTQYGYDELGNKLSQKDALNRETKWEYDQLGRTTKRTLPGGQAETFEYDAAGNLKKHTNFRGEVLSYTYDELNRLATKTVPVTPTLTTTVAYTYTATSQPETVTDNRGVTRYEYDQRDRVTKVTHPEGWTIGYTYDEASNKATHTTQYKQEPIRTTTYEYDNANRVTKITNPENEVFTFGYDANGNKVLDTKPNGTKTVYTYDARNRLTKIEHKKTADDSLIQAFESAYNAQGLRSEITATTTTANCKTTYAYDNLNRLTSAQQPAGANCTAQDYRYAFDVVGNRTTEQGTAVGITPSQFVVDSNDRLTQITGGSKAATYEYDAAGNVTKRADGSNVTLYKFDAENRLVQATLPSTRVINFHYDPEGQLVGQSEGDGSDLTKTIRYLVDKNLPFSQIIEERDGNGKLKARYEYSGMQPLKTTQLVTSGGTESYPSAFYHSDHLSVRLLTAANGSVLNTYTYSPYGELQTQTGTFANVLQFAEERYVSEFGLIYLRARWLDPRTGTFASVDPFGGVMSNPSSLHTRTYANDDPVNFRDPSGRMSLSSVAASIGISVTLNLVANYFDGGLTPQSVGQSILWGTIEGIAFIPVASALAKGASAFGRVVKSYAFRRQLLQSFALVERYGPPLAGFAHLSAQMAIRTRFGRFLISSGSSAAGITGALKHLVQDVINKNGLGAVATTEFAEAIVIQELKVVLEAAMTAGFKHGQKTLVTVNGRTYEVIIDFARVPGQLGSLFHLRIL